MALPPIAGPGRKIALLIDGDNAQASLLENMIAEVGKYGTVTIRRIYGDWTTSKKTGVRIQEAAGNEDRTGDHGCGTGFPLAREWGRRRGDGFFGLRPLNDNGAPGSCQWAADERGTTPERCPSSASPGTGNGRKQEVKSIYGLAAPVPKAVPTPQTSEFLDSIRSVFMESTKAAGAEIL